MVSHCPNISETIITTGLELGHQLGHPLSQLPQNCPNHVEEMIKTGKYLDMINGSQESAENKEIQFITSSSDFEDDQKKYGSIDPRRDKSVDHQYWEDILWNAWHFTKPLYFILHGIRCGGGELTLTKESFRLLPGEWPAAEWDEIKQKHLDSMRDKLIRILKLTRVGKVMEEQLPAGLFEKEPEQGRLFG